MVFSLNVITAAASVPHLNQGGKPFETPRELSGHFRQASCDKGHQWGTQL
jgi:hypothetical protein